MSIIDLTHTLTKDVPTWTGSCGFHLYHQGNCQKGEFLVQHAEMMCGIGTHIDAPSHVIADGENISQIPLSKLIAPGVVCDVSSKIHPDYQVSLDDVKKCGNIQGHIIFFHTGWGQYWNDPLKYRNCDQNGVMHFPTISPEVASYLIDQKIFAIAIDTLSPDGSHSKFLVHRLLLKNKIYIIENVANSHLLPKNNFKVYALPLKIESGSESPIRLIAEK